MTLIKYNIDTFVKDYEYVPMNFSVYPAGMFCIDNFIYAIVQNDWMDGYAGIYKIDTDNNTAELLSLSVVNNTATSFFPQFTSEGYYAYITASTGYIHRVNLTTFLEDGRMYRSDLDTTGTVTTITDNFDDSGVFETIDTGGFSGDNTGDIAKEIHGSL